MAVKMRLTRMGDKKSPFYRVVVIDSRKAQSGEYIDKIGYVDPLKTPAEINIDVEKAKVCSNCFKSWFISCTDVPLPAAMRFFLELFIIAGSARSRLVIDRIIASRNGRRSYTD